MTDEQLAQQIAAKITAGFLEILSDFEEQAKRGDALWRWRDSHPVAIREAVELLITDCKGALRGPG